MRRFFGCFFCHHFGLWVDVDPRYQERRCEYCKLIERQWL